MSSYNENHVPASSTKRILINFIFHLYVYLIIYLFICLFIYLFALFVYLQKSNPTPKVGGGFDLSEEDLAKQFNALSTVLQGK